ncbi:MAG: hypothetical protein Q8O28_11545 [Smithellaceae bacterium]|nr:hypothetical protein [Smithellaceae bacterium]
MDVIETINLPNGLKLTVTDSSRRIAADTTKVELTFQVKVEVLESYFTSPDDYFAVKNALGNELTYEHTMERSFVYDKDEVSVRVALLDTFKNNSLNYLSSPNFAKKMALSQLKDIRLNPFKYRAFPYPERAE